MAIPGQERWKGVTDLDLGSPILSSFIYLFPFQAPLPFLLFLLFDFYFFISLLLIIEFWGNIRQMSSRWWEIHQHCVVPGNPYLVALPTSSAEKDFKLAILTISIGVKDNWAVSPETTSLFLARNKMHIQRSGSQMFLGVIHGANTAVFVQNFSRSVVLAWNR